MTDLVYILIVSFMFIKLGKILDGETEADEVESRFGATRD